MIFISVFPQKLLWFWPPPVSASPFARPVCAASRKSCKTPVRRGARHYIRRFLQAPSRRCCLQTISASGKTPVCQPNCYPGLMPCLSAQSKRVPYKTLSHKKELPNPDNSFFTARQKQQLFSFIQAPNQNQPVRPCAHRLFSRCACQPYSTVGTAGQPAKASSATCASFGMRILVKLVQPAKAPRPIFSTLCGSTTSVSCLQSRKAS